MELKLSRLAGLTDGVFAIAMTILVFGLSLPPTVNNSQLPTIMKNDIIEKIFIYAGSFIILGTQWISINFQHAFIDKINRQYIWVNIIYLMIICVIPFSASLLINYTTNPISINFYTGNLLCAGLAQLLIFYTGIHLKLNGPDFVSKAKIIILRRIFIPPIFYLFSLIVAQWSIHAAFVFLVIPPLFHMIPGKVDGYFTRK